MANQPKPGMDRFFSHEDYAAAQRRTAKSQSLALPGLIMVGLVGLTWAAFTRIPSVPAFKQVLGLGPESSQMSEAFRRAVNKAMLAAELTQTAQYQEEWKKVEFLWTEAVELMADVPDTSAQYAIAQEKVGEYGRNRKYATGNVLSRPSGAPLRNQLWSKGTTREFLLAVQGPPTAVNAQAALCKEIYKYDKSEVEIRHGLVNRYNNRDNNLNASPAADADLESLRENFRRTGYWALGSPVQDVLAIQGTPTRVKNYDALATDIFYYDHNLVELYEDIVVGYSNFDGTLRIDTDAMIPGVGHDAIVTTNEKTWSIGSSRAEIFKIQGTPDQVERNVSDCLETFHYEDSTIELFNGVVQEYDNFSNNLKVHLTRE